MCLLPDTYRAVSSANIRLFASVAALGRSLIYKRKSKGPRVEPWGTPVVMPFISEVLPLTTVFRCLFER